MRRHCAPARRDDGSAMIITLLALALVTALASTVSVLAIDNLQSSKRAQLAGAAIDAADAGVAQAMTYLRSSGVRGLRCAPTCDTNAWGNSEAPTSVTLPGGSGSYRVWIDKIHPFPANDPGTYRIHSTGDVDDASRSVSVDVQVTTSNVPKGLFAKSFTGGGSASVTRESVFSTGCVWQRSHILTPANPEAPQNLDAAYGIPVGVHTSNYITEANGSARYCSTSTSKLIHKSGSGAHATQSPCSTSYPYDQDKLGGAPTSACPVSQQALPTTYPDYYAAQDLDGDTTIDVTGSWIKDDASLLNLFDLKADPFTDAELDQLRTIAESQDNYWKTSDHTVWEVPDEDNAVMFFDLEGSDLGGTVDLNYFGDTKFSRAPGLADDTTCPTTSLLIVIVGGNVEINSHTQMAASIFLTSPAPNGQVVKGNGNADFIGTLYADKINLVGTFDASLDPCFLANTSPALLSLSVGSYREDDRGLD